MDGCRVQGIVYSLQFLHRTSCFSLNTSKVIFHEAYVSRSDLSMAVPRLPLQMLHVYYAGGVCQLDAASITLDRISDALQSSGALCICCRGSDALAVIEEQQRKLEALGFTILWAWWPSVQADWQLGHHKQV